MTDKAFICILKTHYKRYFESGESVGMEVSELVELFRKEIEDEIIEKRKSKIREFINQQKPVAIVKDKTVAEMHRELNKRK